MTELFGYIHLFSFICFFALFAVLEYYFPLREKTADTKKRWFHNWTLSFINTVIIRFLVFVTPVSFAFFAAEKNIGIFNIFGLPVFLEILLALIVLDFCIYLQHVASHKLNWFWKLHQIHHSDENLDVTTALRFHFGEMCISVLYKILLIAIFGFSAISVLIFEIVLVVSTMFNHANLKLPQKMDALLGKIFVTPEFHQVHHSAKHQQTDSNYGFFLSIWDKLFKTYTPYKFFVEKLGLSYTKNNLSLLELMSVKIRKK